ncbi:MAG: PAS domain S-box protein [Acidobacteria bacterium]|nr:PAS domain S-box protein [Acidobacteriota bacterium]
MFEPSPPVEDLLLPHVLLISTAPDPLSHILSQSGFSFSMTTPPPGPELSAIPDIVVTQHVESSLLTQLNTRFHLIPIIGVVTAQEEDTALEQLEQGRLQDYVLLESPRRLKTCITKLHREYFDRRLRRLVNEIPEAVTLVSSDGSTKYTSQNNVYVLGRELPEVQGINGFTFIHPDDVPLLKAEFDQLLIHPEIIKTALVRIQHKDGTWRWIEGKAQNHLSNPKLKGIVFSFHDVTERKLAEDRLREREEWFRTLVEKSFEAMAVVNQHGIVTYITPPIEQITGRRPNQIIGQSPYANVHPDEVEQIREQTQIFMSHPNEGRIIETRIQHTNGDWRVVEMYSRNLLENPIVQGIVVNFRDVTEQRATLEALKQSQSRLNGILNWMREILWSVSLPDFRTLYLNPAIEGITGYPASDFFHTPQLWETCVHPDDLGIVRQRVEKCKVQPEGELTYRVIHKNGNIRWVQDRFRIVFDAEENPILLEGLVIDLTEQREAAEALRQSRAHFQALLEVIPFDIWIRDISHRCTYQNAQSVKHWGSIVGQLPDEANQPQETIAKWKANHARVFNGEHIDEENVFLVNGEERVLWQLILPIWDEGKICGIVGINIDVTERRREEEERQKLSRLESLGVLAGGIAHDFNNLLAAILGNVSLARHMLDNPTKVDAKLQVVENAVDRARALAQQLLTFSKGGAPHRMPTDITSVLSEAAIFALRGSNVKCRFEFDSGLWEANVDPNQIGQVVQNLVLNARDALPGGGQIAISATNEMLDEDSPLPLKAGAYLRLRFSDEGVGIQPEHIHKIFDPYFTTKNHGSGLGLAVVHSIVRRHSGHITVNSQPGQGTQFTIWVPAIPVTPTELLSPDVDSNSPQFGNLRILVLEDDPLVGDLLKDSLECLGCEVTKVVDGTEAISAFQAAQQHHTPFHLVILDLTIPGGTGGVDTLHQLQKLDSTVQAVACSGHVNDPCMVFPQRHGFINRLVKPFSIDDLTRLLQSIHLISG